MNIKKLEYPSYLTEDQKNTLDSLKKFDGKNNLYEINYTAPVKTEEILSLIKTPEDCDNAVSEILLPDSPIKLRFNVSELGCSCFCAKNNKNETILGRNYDFYNTDHICAICRTDSKTGYSYIGLLDLFFFGLNADNLNETEKRIQLLYSPLQIQDGINEKGFACAIQMLFEGRCEQNRNKTKLISTFAVSLLLNKAATVKEAVSILKNYDILPFFPTGDFNHKWIMCDRAGDMAVCEYRDGELYVTKSASNIVSANYYLSRPILGQKGKGFLRTAYLKNFLNIMPNPTDKKAMEFLKNVRYSLHLDFIDSDILERQDKEDDITYWSQIFNTETKTMDFVFKEDYSKVYRIGF